MSCYTKTELDRRLRYFPLQLKDGGRTQLSDLQLDGRSICQHRVTFPLPFAIKTKPVETYLFCWNGLRRSHWLKISAELSRKDFVPNAYAEHRLERWVLLKDIHAAVSLGEKLLAAFPESVK